LVSYHERKENVLLARFRSQEFSAHWISPVLGRSAAAAARRSIISHLDEKSIEPRRGGNRWRIDVFPAKASSRRGSAEVIVELRSGGPSRLSPSISAR